MTPLLVALGAAVGAPARYLVDRAVDRWVGTRFPAGTVVVNVVGSFVLGVVAGLPAGPAVSALVGTGFCGALTTYSTFGFDAFRLAREKRVVVAAAYVVGSLVLGLTAAWVGMRVA
ncbi:fluoride efflux transporter CrcB [Actinokineospora bangkokensis]|uniref:Fluoride-specific ion channel FluC n=1 Tax=Actinokineospora bangkokensis TaxID=1193682 RepID=A0A1Q9LKC7_9PSEU|nr:fluoride efflux transporter CrcB [Actinokineospora bangkokensis]OLR92507.1 chromosome condensation protein CrcB [Actinokineospora bangkokensis]